MSTIMCWIAAVLRWAWRARFVLVALGPALAAAVAAFLVWRVEPTFRLSGLGLQSLGIATVGWGILKTRRFFGLPSVGLALAQWLKSFPRIRTHQIHAVGISSQVAIGDSVRATVLSTAGPDDSVDRRVQVLEDNLRRTISRFDAHEADTDQRFASLGREVRSSRETVDQSVRDVARRLDRSQTGGLYISAIGAFWILIGMILATASLELSRLVV
jgi:hypothetical protein